MLVRLIDSNEIVSSHQGSRFEGGLYSRNFFQDEKPNVQFNSQFLLCKLTKWIYLVEYDPV